MGETGNVQYQATGDLSTDLLDANETEVWLKAYVTSGGDYDVVTTDPVEITATDADIAAAAEAKIDTALALEATKANKTAYDTAKSAYDALTDAQKALVTASKVTSLTNGIAAIQAIIDAENAAAAGELVIYVQNSLDWDGMCLYSWIGGTQLFGAWPGNEMTACEDNEGWYSAKFNITAAVDMIFNYDGTQTENIEGVSAGTYWYTLETNGEGQIVATASTIAPEGWVEEEAADVDVELPTEDENAGNENTTTSSEGNNGTVSEGNGSSTAPTTADTTPVAVAVVAILALGLGVVVLNSKKANR